MSLFDEVSRDTFDREFPAIHAEVFETDGRVPYLQEPGVALIAKPSFSMAELADGFFDSFDPTLRFDDYPDDEVTLPDGEGLAKFAGQLCYLSFGPNRTKNEAAEKYFENIMSSGHGSVLEHANYSFLLYGISRSLTHELVRHRAGFAFSQVSQRYVDGSKLRFVERPEFQRDPDLHAEFLERIEHVYDTYEGIARRLVEDREKCDAALRAAGITSTLSKTDMRKQVNQVARCVLPNETEAPIIVTANARAWRHFLNMRGSSHAETEIRRVAVRIHQILSCRKVAPLLVSDISLGMDGNLPAGNTTILRVTHPKV